MRHVLALVEDQVAAQRDALSRGALPTAAAVRPGQPAAMLPEALLPPPVKCLVFSQWVPMLQLAEAALRHNGVRCVSLRGGRAALDAALEAFQRDPQLTVMLMNINTDSSGERDASWRARGLAWALTAAPAAAQA